MRHARSLVSDQWPGAPVEEAKRTMFRVAEGRYASRQVDIFDGCFDLLVLGHHDVQLIQITASGGEGFRKTKIRRRFCEPYKDYWPPGARPRVHVWAWVPRRGFLAWEWDWAKACWGERTMIYPSDFKRSA